MTTALGHVDPESRKRAIAAMLEVTPEDFLHAASSPDVKILRSAGADATRSFVQRLGSRGQSRMTI
jgi:hypothetical protein